MVGQGGTLAGLDLSLKLTPKQEETRLVVAQDRLLHLRLVLGCQAGVKVVESVVGAIEAGLAARKLPVPPGSSGAARIA